jgi:hypothetical protein
MSSRKSEPLVEADLLAAAEQYDAAATAWLTPGIEDIDMMLRRGFDDLTSAKQKLDPSNACTK